MLKVGNKVFLRQKASWLDQIFSDLDLTPMARCVAFSIGREFDLETFIETDDLFAAPSYDELAIATGSNVRTIQRSVIQLVEQGHVATTGGRGRGRTLVYLAVLKPKGKPVRKTIAFLPRSERHE